MDEEEIKILDECVSVIEFVNKNMQTDYELEQLSATSYSFAIKEGDKRIYKATLRECDKALIGMLILAKTLIREGRIKDKL